MNPLDERALRAWLTDWLARRLDIPTTSIDPDEPLAALGLNSLGAVELSGALETLLDRALPPTMAYEAPTVASLARHLTAPDRPAPPPSPMAQDDAIAVIGIGCRFPGGAATPETFWDRLEEGYDAIAEAPSERLRLFADAAGSDADLLQSVSRPGGYLEEDLAAFDAEFFGLAAREATATDPQQRLMLEVTWEALEHAGIAPRSLAGTRTGVFVGASASDYGILQMSDLARVDAWSGTGSALSVIANRVSYTLGLRGPSMAVDTACSSSLVAVHQAVRSLRTGESELALAGGVNLLLSPAVTVNFEEAGVMAGDGRCKTFSAAADGYGRGEGCGVVVLKRLSAALRDGDRVLAIVRGSAVNQDGASNGLMAPNPAAQEELLRLALADAALHAEDIDYVEAHGTGTALGDPIEVEAVAAALVTDGAPRGAGADLLIGSVKTNIGHLEAAAGVAGLIKVVLSLVHQQLPPSLHFDEPNPLIPFGRLPLSVVTRGTPWPVSDRVRRAGVSGFGFGGTNAHIVVEEAPAAPGTTPSAPNVSDEYGPSPFLMPLSAGSPDALGDQACRLADLLTRDGAARPLPDVVHTLALRRSHEAHRLAVVARDRESVIRALRAHADGIVTPATAHGYVRDADGPVWVFSGQGSQWSGMGDELLRSEPVFRKTVDELEPLVAAEAGFSLHEMLRSSEVPTDVHFVQPLLLAMQLGLARMWQDHGVRPVAVIGHSMGEVAAAVVAGALTVEDGVRVICRRSQLLTRVAGQGAMAAVELPEDVLAERIAADIPDSTVEIAVVAGPETTVVSGDPDAVRRLVDLLEEEGTGARLVQVDVASHSPQMDPLLGPLRELLTDLVPSAPDIPFFSTVGGRLDAVPACDADYWADNLRAPVCLADAVRAASAAGHRVFVEVSPHPVLARDVQATLLDAGADDAVVSSTLLRDSDPYESFLTALGRLYCHGQRVPWERLVPRGSLVDLPRMSWRRRRYWTSARPAAVSEDRTAPDPRRLLGTGTPLAALPGARLWQTTLTASRLGPLAEHKVAGQALLPVSAYLRAALEAAEEMGWENPVLRDLTLRHPLALDTSEPCLQVLLRPSSSVAGSAELEFHCRTAAGEVWTPCATARLHDDPGELPALRSLPMGRPDAVPVEGVEHYERLTTAGLEYGPRLRVVRKLWQEGEAVLAEAEPSGSAAEPAQAMLVDADGGAGFSQALDAAFQALPACGALGASGGTWTVVGVDSFSLRDRRSAAGSLQVRADALDDGDVVSATLEWYRDGGLWGRARGVRIRRLDGGPSAVPPGWVRALRWAPDALPSAVSSLGPDAPAVLVIGGDAAFAAGVERLRGPDQATRVVSADGLADAEPAELAERLGSLEGVRHLVYCPPAAPAADPGGTAPRAVTTGRLGLALVRALVLTRPAGVRLWFATVGAQAVEDEPALDPAHAVLWGLGRSVALEHPDLWGGLVDLGPADTAERRAEALVAELASGRTGGQAARRGPARHVPRLDPAVLRTEGPRRLDGEGSHLVVGATGRIGPLLLDRLVRLGARHLVLVSRHGARGEGAAAVARMRDRGVIVTEVAADVADEEAMHRLFARFGSDLPSLRGVVHAAFEEDVSALADLSGDRLAAVLSPKVAGLALLHELAAGHQVTDFLCYSSTTGLLGSQGLGHYAAASSFVDTFVHARRRAGLPAHVIDWGPWADGLGADRREVITATGMRLMPGATAVAALDHVLSGREPQVVIADADWPALAAAYATRTPLPLLEGLTDAEPDGVAEQGRVPDPSEPTGTGRRAEVHRRVREVVATALGLSDPAALDPRSDFAALGMDSLTTMTVLRRLRVLAPALRPEAVRRNSTAATLADAVLDLLDHPSGG